MFNKEPAFIFNGLAEILRQLVPLLIVFGLIQWTDVQIAAVFAFSSVLLTFLASLLTRSQTVPTQAADAQIHQATLMPANTPVEEVRAAVAAKEGA